MLAGYGVGEGLPVITVCGLAVDRGTLEGCTFWNWLIGVVAGFIVGLIGDDPKLVCTGGIIPEWLNAGELFPL